MRMRTQFKLTFFCLLGVYAVVRRKSKESLEDFMCIAYCSN